MKEHDLVYLKEETIISGLTFKKGAEGKIVQEISKDVDYYVSFAYRNRGTPLVVYLSFAQLLSEKIN